MKIHNFILFITALVLSLLFSACEEEYIPPTIVAEEQIVVEGYIEAKYKGNTSKQNIRPPYVILTRSKPFFSSIDAEELEKLFVHNALVTLSDGKDSVRLQEICMENLTEAQRKDAIDLFGINLGNNNINFCIYIDYRNDMLPQEGRKYSIRIEAEGKVVTATTSIPQHVPLDTIVFKVPDNDSTGLAYNRNFREMRIGITDPAHLQSYYRYFTEVDNKGFVPGYTSVMDDRFFDGKKINDFPLSKGEPRTPDNNPGVFGFGLYRINDSVVLKWTNVDENQYNFWNALEFNTINQGPFSGATGVQSNIKGGIGVWGGASVSFYEAVVPR